VIADIFRTLEAIGYADVPEQDFMGNGQGYDMSPDAGTDDSSDVVVL
jgi:hypothetical protein